MASAMLSRAMTEPAVLICDSDASAVRALASILERTCVVTTTGSLAQTFSLLRPSTPDVIICELNDQSLAAMESWSELAPAAAIVFSYTRSDALVAHALRAGAAHCLPRPVDAQVVQILINRVIEQRRLRELADRSSARIERELADARWLQAAMLPPGEARVGAVTVATRWRPCAELGGDLVDYAGAGESSLA